jgi:tetratricopeptide (TPR) repeat protein
MTRLLLLLTLVLLPTLRAQEAAALPAADQRRLADGLHARGLHAMALAEYEKLLSIDPPVPEQDVVAFRAAESARQMGDTERARALYERALRVVPAADAGLRSRLRLAELHLRAERLPEAKQQVEALIAAKAQADLDAAARYLLGQILQREGKEPEARTVFLELIERYPNDVFAVYSSLGLARIERKDPVTRRAYYERALKNPPSEDVEVEALWGLATLESENGERVKAAERFTRLWKQHPDSARVRGGMLHMAWAQLQAANYAEALELAAQTSDARKKEHAETWLYLEAVSRRELGEIEASRSLYTTLMNEHGESRFRATAAYDLAVLHARVGEPEKVLPLAEDVLNVPGRRADGLWLLAESARAANRTPLAFQYYTDISRLPEPNPRAADARYLRAMLLQTQDPKAAAEAYREFVRLHPQDARAPAALRAAGALRLDAADLAGALEMWDKVLKEYPADPLNADVLFQAAVLEMRMERPAAAVTRLLKYASLDPAPARVGEAAFWLGTLLDQAGKATEAEPWLQKAVAGTVPEDQRARARLRLGLLLQRAKRDAEALSVLRPLLGEKGERAPADEVLVWMMRQADVLSEQETLAETAAAMTSEARAATTREIGFYALGRHALRLQKTDEAIQAFRSGLALGSQTLDAAEASYELGRLLNAGKEFPEAEERLSTAARLASQLEQGLLQARALHALGDVLAARERWEEAARMYMSVAVLYDEAEITPAALRAAAAAYEKAGRRAEAASALQEVQKRYPPTTTSEIPDESPGP